MSTDSEGWRQQMEALIGMSPEEPEVEDGGKKDRVPAGAPFTWIAANFAHCPEDADDEVIQSWTMLVAGPQRTVELVVVCSYFQYGAGNAYLLDALKAQSGIPGMTTATLFDRRRQRKIKDWHKHHKSYVIMFEQSVQAASSIQRTEYRQHCPLAFKNYLRWFQESTRVEICPPAYEEDILEEPTEYDALAQGDYNKLIREGYQTSFAPALNFVRKEVKKQADESEDILEKTPGGKKGESALRLFIKVADGMTLNAFQRSAYMLKPRKEFRRYSSEDYAKGKNPVAGGSRLSRMRSLDDEDDDDDDDESDDPEQFVVSRRKKLLSKRGRGDKM
ncbi:mutator protein [Hordeum vulgare]|nr:mutator protein [Hordeum vulgare]